MKSIEITNIQRLELLVMCKKLFSEFNTIKFGTSTGLGGNKDYLYFYKLNTDTICHHYIHWFEFTLTHLINTIALSKCTSDLLQDIQFEQNRMKFINNIMSDKTDKDYIHPVDYMYNLFKKLRL